MSLDSYAGLKAEIADLLDRDDLSGQIDSFIDLAEARHRREIRIREMRARQQADLNGQYEVLPPGFIAMRELRIITSPLSTLTEVSDARMTSLRSKRSSAQAGRPCFFTASDELEFERVPDQTYTMEMKFFKELTPLSDSNTTNALLVRAPDAYLYGALSASAPFLEHEERLPTWEAIYVSVRDELNRMDRRLAGPLVSRVVGATP